MLGMVALVAERLEIGALEGEIRANLERLHVMNFSSEAAAPRAAPVSSIKNGAPQPRPARDRGRPCGRCGRPSVSVEYDDGAAGVTPQRAQPGGDHRGLRQVGAAV